jgi:hypothetical protein
LQLTPKIIDTVFAKLPGVLAEALANLGLRFPDSKRRVVVYDFEKPLDRILFSYRERIAKDLKDRKQSSDEDK